MADWFIIRISDGEEMDGPFSSFLKAEAAAERKAWFDPKLHEIVTVKENPMVKEFGFHIYDLFGKKRYFAASYPNKKMAVDAAREYLSGKNRVDWSADVVENENANGDYRSPKWRTVWTLGERQANPSPIKKPSPAQLAARKAFGAAAKARAKNPAKPATRKRNPAQDDSIPGDFSQSSRNILGRAWSDAATASLKEIGSDAVVRLTWDDGEWLQMVFDSKAGALKNLQSLGFAKK